MTEMKLFEAQCWVSPPSTTAGTHAEPPFLTVAFCSSVELVQPGGGADGGGVPLAIQFTMADPWGVAYSSPTSITGARRARARVACMRARVRGRPRRPHSRAAPTS